MFSKSHFAKHRKSVFLAGVMERRDVFDEVNAILSGAWLVTSRSNIRDARLHCSLKAPSCLHLDDRGVPLGMPS
jgi:hypothetical protein